MLLLEFKLNKVLVNISTLRYMPGTTIASFRDCAANFNDFFFFYFLDIEGFLTIEGPYPEKEWCIADEQTPGDILQQALDWACGYGGADCKMIQPNKPCYLPNTVRDHASYAFNSYWQKFKNKGGSCYFNAAAMVTDLDPSMSFPLSCQNIRCSPFLAQV